MDSSNNAFVSSTSLIELQNNLIQLSDHLKELYEVLSNNINSLAEIWQDEKFDEFDEEFKSRREQIFEISERYYEWATKSLQTTIENTMDIEGHKVGIN